MNKPKLNHLNLNLNKQNQQIQQKSTRANTFKFPKSNLPNSNYHYQSADKRPTFSQPKKITHQQSFLEDSIIINIQPQTGLKDLPPLDQMPSLQLQSAKSIILSPRGLDDFMDEVRQFEQKCKKKLISRQLFKTMKQKIDQPIHINWKQFQNHYRTQVVRNNSNKAYYQKFKKYCEQKKQKYTDGIFLPNLSAFTNTSKNIQRGSLINNCLWKRIQCQQNTLSRYKDPIQGIYKTQKLISCFLSLPIRNRMYLIQNQRFDNNSIFYIKLNKQGFWRYIVLDNIFPFTSNGISFLSQGFIMSLLQKAWAKYLGSYQKLDSIEELKQSQIITDLTGAPSEQILSTHPKLQTVLNNFLNQKYILIASVSKSLEKRQKLQEVIGVASDYSYPIQYIVDEFAFLRNQWGYKQDSIFFGQQNFSIKVNELKNYFDIIVVNKIIQNPYYNSLPVRQKKGFYSLVELRTSTKTKAFITLSQIDKLNNFEQYSNCKIIIFKQNEERIVHCKQIESQSKQTNIQIELGEQIYLILVEIKWVAKQYETILSVMSDNQVELNKLKYNQQNDYLLDLKKAKTKSQRKMRLNDKNYQYQLGPNKSVRSAKNK